MTDAAPTPAVPTTKGMYLECAMQLIAERQGMDAAKLLAGELGLDPTPSPMRSYPLKDLSRLVFSARDKFWPDESDEALAQEIAEVEAETDAEIHELARKVESQAAPVEEAKATCRVDDCDRAPRAKGFCAKHYQRWRRGTLEGFPFPE